MTWRSLTWKKSIGSLRTHTSPKDFKKVLRHAQNCWALILVVKSEGNKDQTGTLKRSWVDWKAKNQPSKVWNQTIQGKMSNNSLDTKSKHQYCSKTLALKQANDN